MLKSYYLPSTRLGEGYAYIVINTENGFFSTVSDYGNYAFLWSDPGCEFRKFLVALNADYLFGKLMMGRPERHVADEEATRRAVWEQIRSLARQFGKDDERYTRERDLYRRAKGEAFETREGFAIWYQETHIDCAYELWCSKPDPQCMAFCTKIMPRFQKVLQKELDEERSRAESSATETRG